MFMTNKLKVWVHGCEGRMGLTIRNFMSLEKDSPFSYWGGSDRQTSKEELHRGLFESDLILDFSSIEGNQLLLNEFKAASIVEKSLVIGTTSVSEETFNTWAEISKKANLRTLIAPNTSLGILLILKSALSIVNTCFRHDFDLEITETHHRMKTDSPSGTALFLGKSIAKQASDKKIITHRNAKRKQDEIAIHSMRGGGVFGEHSIHLLGDFEEITITHKAFSRDLFAKGALTLGQWLMLKNPGCYELMDLV
jgi:4-hydroxy-tetrahydrodipicolinate reductase